MKQMTEQEALQKLSAMCAKAEHCSGDMKEKMRRWDISDDVQERIMKRLVNEKYIDDERFCRLFVNDKIRYNKWGRRKIENTLWLKGVPKSVSTPVLDAVDNDEYIEVLRGLIESKRRQIKAGNLYETNMKLIKFALSRGFTMDIIRECVDDC